MDKSTTDSHAPSAGEAVTDTLGARVAYALSRPEAAESGRRLADLAQQVDEPIEKVYEALETLCERGLATYHPWPASGRRGTWFAALEPPSGYGVRTTLGRASLGRTAGVRPRRAIDGVSL
jgi:hypothetical protein